MRRRAPAVSIALTCLAIFLACPTVVVSGPADDGDAKGKAAGTDLFGLAKVVGLHIEISADEYQAMQPPAPAAFGAPPPAPRPKRPGERESERNLFGVEFPWARGAMTAEGKTHKGVRLRYAGNASYMASAGGLKRSFLVDLERIGQPGFPWAACAGAAKRRARPGKGSRGPRLRPVPRGGRARPPHGPGRGDAHRPGPVTTRHISACIPSSSPWTGRS